MLCVYQKQRKDQPVYLSSFPPTAAKQERPRARKPTSRAANSKESFPKTRDTMMPGCRIDKKPISQRQARNRKDR